MGKAGGTAECLDANANEAIFFFCSAHSQTRMLSVSKYYFSPASVRTLPHYFFLAFQEGRRKRSHHITFLVRLVLATSEIGERRGRRKKRGGTIKRAARKKWGKGEGFAQERQNQCGFFAIKPSKLSTPIFHIHLKIELFLAETHPGPSSHGGIDPILFLFFFLLFFLQAITHPSERHKFQTGKGRQKRRKKRDGSRNGE